MSQYFRLLVSFFKYSLMADLEYRMNIVIRIFTDIIWYAAQLSLFEVLFRHLTTIGDWNLQSVRIFMGVLFTVDAICMMLFSENLEGFSEKIRKGDLDMLLTKPINSQFIMSLQRIGVSYLINVFISLGFLFYSIHQLENTISWIGLLSLIVTIPCGVIFFYSMRFFFAAIALFLTRADSIGYVWYNLYRLATRPDAIYPNYIRYVILSFVPVAFIASVPAGILLGQESPWMILASLILAGGFLYLSNLFWKLALKNYSSASS